MNNARKLVSIVEKIPYDAELCSGRYVVNAKSMLGVLSMPEFEVGELHIHTDEEIECSNILEKLLENGLLADTYDAAKRSLYDITTFGEILIDFTWQESAIRDRHCLLRIQEELRQMLQLLQKNLGTYSLYRKGRKKICTENF